MHSAEAPASKNILQNKLILCNAFSSFPILLFHFRTCSSVWGYAVFPYAVFSPKNILQTNSFSAMRSVASRACKVAEKALSRS